MYSLTISNNFDSINDKELFEVNGGEFWNGLAITAAAVGLGIAAVAAAPAAITIGAAVGVSVAMGAACFGTGVGLAEMLGANL